MKLINRENGEELVEVGSHKDYASKGVAGAGLGLGIAGTALWLLSGGLGGGLFGNRFGAAGAAALGVESTVEKEDKCELVNGMWQLAFNGQTARFNDRNQINAEMFGIYKSQVDADFGLYKSTRDSFDITNARVGELEKQVAVLIATRPFDEVYATYQVDNMYHTDNKGNKITSPMFTPIDVRKLYDKKFKSINSNITFWDVYVALNAQYHDNIELYKEWFGEDNIENIKDKIIESAIVNWFEDEDAGIEKVWNYFRAI